MIKELFFAKLRRKGTIFFLYIKATIVFFNFAGLRKRFFLRLQAGANIGTMLEETAIRLVKIHFHGGDCLILSPAAQVHLPYSRANPPTSPKAEARPPFTLYAMPPRVGCRLQQRKPRPCGILGNADAQLSMNGKCIEVHTQI